jgi:hypothetical protein
MVRITILNVPSHYKHCIIKKYDTDHKSPITENVVGNDLQLSHNYSTGIFIHKLISVKGLGQSFDMEFRTSKGEGGFQLFQLQH